MDRITLVRLPWKLTSDRYAEWHNNAIAALDKKLLSLKKKPPHTLICSSHIADPEQFIKSHMTMIKHNVGNKRFHSYTCRVIEYVKYCSKL